MGQIVLQLDDTGAPTHRYLWSPAVDQILADEVVDDGGAEDVRWTLTDHQNSVRDLVEYNPVTDEAEVVNHITYDSYGNTNAAVDCLFGFTGRLFDTATGLQNNLNRWYDPEVGRWISEDPIGFEGGDANLYRYVANDPGNGVDPGGLEEDPWWDDSVWDWADFPFSYWGFRHLINHATGYSDAVDRSNELAAQAKARDPKKVLQAGDYPTVGGGKSQLENAAKYESESSQFFRDRAADIVLEASTAGLGKVLGSADDVVKLEKARRQQRPVRRFSVLTLIT